MTSTISLPWATASNSGSARSFGELPKKSIRIRGEGESECDRPNEAPASSVSTAVLALANAATIAPASGMAIDGRYVIDRELGRGAMGLVYRAHDKGLDRTVALKVIDPEIARNPQIGALFRREATALARVRSEHVVQVHSFGTHQGAPFFVMEYVEGADLDAIITSYSQRGGVVPIHRAATILRQAASGLAAVHAYGIVHRDVKPSNVLLESGSGRPVLIDFGLAHAATGEDAGAVIGTPHYMAPEQWTGESTATPATDVYGFGALAYELLTGAPPFNAETVQDLMRQHTSAPVPRVSDKRASASAFDAVVAKAMAKSPTDRYADAGALVAALDDAIRGALLQVAPAAFDLNASPSLLEGVALDALVIDDDEGFRAFAERALRIAASGLPLRVRGVSSGEAALALARTGMPDLIVLDFDMPGLNGLETLSYLRAMPNGARARVLVVTGSVEKIGRCQFDVMGVADFVAKPVALRELAKTLGAMAKRA
jgi:serine/threonine protein kinase